MQDHGYKYIVMWGHELGSRPGYIERECWQAKQDGAPLNAIYKRDGHWQTTDTIANNPLRVRLGLEPLPPEHPVILRVYGGEPASVARTGTERHAEFRFPDLVHAARWVGDKGLTSRARLIGYSVQGFDRPATVRLLPASENETR